MYTIGLVGGVGSGKSLVASEFERLGAVVWDGDMAGHAVLDVPEVQQAIVARWGPAIMTPYGAVDRRALARIVFASPPEGPRELEALERLTHPPIQALLEERIAELKDSGTRVVVLDAAVLLKAGWDRFCDKIIFVDAPRETRMARCRQRGWSDQELASREAAQEPLDAKRARAHATIDNSGSPASTRSQVQRLWYDMIPVV
jgi:dephospho-CoA kinase